ncbi:MAG: hypothetical protein ACYTE8_06275 [Planctomycetota bacterium]|jgi:hypothetical protein
MGLQKFVRFFWFVIFFSAGALTLSLSVLASDLMHYYQNKHLLRISHDYHSQLESLNTDYDILLQQVENDPNIIKRIAPAMFGTESSDTESISPKMSPEQLEMAREVLKYADTQQTELPYIPNWLERTLEPRRRTILFISGAFLILIAFIWFGPAKFEKS